MRLMLITGTALLCMLSTFAQADDKPLKPIPAKKGDALAGFACPIWPVYYDPNTGLYYYYAYIHDENCENPYPDYAWGNAPAPVYECDPMVCFPAKAVSNAKAPLGDENLRRTLPRDGRFQKGGLPVHFRRNTKAPTNIFLMKFDHDGDGIADKLVRFHRDIEVSPKAACNGQGLGNCDKAPDSLMICIGFESQGNAENFPEVPADSVKNITHPGDGANSKFVIRIDDKDYLVFLRNL